MYMRSSQINGCPYCLDLHVRDAVKAGVALQRLAVLPACVTLRCSRRRSGRHRPWQGRLPNSRTREHEEATAREHLSVEEFR
ncbi:MULTISPECIES: carboxymuconolactone decarboxylase family protein [unclassified Arthrobacter]|uniref:carboxymuconolactone decarboxylase family protein n=1 Tax=unclassified Arthrobacter TaxID=235627 RepID=UPI003395A7E0